MELLRTDLVLDTSRRHLASLQPGNPDIAEISSYLAQVASITFYSEVEEHIKRIVDARLRASGDHRIAHFIFKNKEGMIKRISKSDIVETIVQFGDDCRQELNNRFRDDEISAYSNVIKSRHETAHRQGGTITLDEVKAAKDVAERLLNSVEEIIRLP